MPTPAPATGSRLVSAADLEDRLVAIGRTVGDNRAGLFGPDSQLWTVNRHAAMFLGGGRAALLQIAHPAVAQAIAHHSRTRTDPFGRFQRTFRQVFSMVWGDTETAFRAARQVHSIHRRITGVFEESVGPFRQGERYAANDRSSLLWVHATLWESSVRMHETFVGPLGEATREAYYQETRRFAALFGLDDTEIPDSWAAFADYNRRMWEGEVLAAGSAAREIARYLFRAPDPVFQPAFDLLRLLTAHLLPEAVAEAFGLTLGAAEARRAEQRIRVLRRVLPRLPARLRYVPPYFDALHRLGRARRSPLDSWLQRIYVGS